nr:hypothetical protein [Tanacetum cinerariifolium]
PVAGIQIARRVFDDLVDFSGDTSVARCMKFFFEQQIFDRHRFINRMREELQTSTNLLGQLTALIAKLEAFPDPGEVFNTLMCLRDDVRDEQAMVDDLNDCIARRVYYLAYVVLGIVCGCYRLEFGEEVTGSPRIGVKMKYVFGRSRFEDESLGCLMRNLCSGLRVSLSNKRRLVAELEALGESKGDAKYLEHIRVIVGHVLRLRWL